MNNDNVIAFQPAESASAFSDALTQLVRQGARQIIAQAVEAELKEFLAQYQTLKDDQGRAAIVRNGYLRCTPLSRQKNDQFKRVYCKA